MKWINFGEKTRHMASMAVSRMINSFRNPAHINYRTILCIKDDEIGDMCYSTHVFAMLRKQYPESRITVLCKNYSRALIESSPDINSVVTDWKELKGRFDLIVELRSTWKSMLFSIRKWPEARLDRGTVRVGDAWNGHYPHEIETNFKVVESIISPQNRISLPLLYISEADKNAAAEYIKANGIRDFAILHINARRELRRWPIEQYCRLASWLNAEKGLQIVFTGDQSDASEIEKARAALNFETFSTAGKLTLGQLAALMQSAAIYIGNESGPLHIAAVQNVPSIGLYGPGPKDIFYPRGKNSSVIHHILECNPCDQVHCKYPGNPCISRITLNEVTREVEKIINYK